MSELLCKAGGMNSVTNGTGRIVGLVARNSIDYFDKFFDIVARGDIVVPLRDADDAERIRACGVDEIVVPQDVSGWIDRSGTLPAGERVAQIAFTSGTQGRPKGVILTQANLAATVERLCAVMGLDASIREYVGVPVNHSFGLGRLRAVAAVGGRAYLPRDGFNPREIAAMLRAGEINAISAVPTLWRSLLRTPEIIGPLGARVRWIEIGSQPMTGDEKRALRALFPKARIIQHYGLTEASRTTFLDIGTADDAELESVGAPTGDVEIGVTPAGLIRIRGVNVARELLIDGRRVANTDAEGWITTSDLGVIRDGRLHFLGRADDMLNLGGLKVSADALERDIVAAAGVDPAELSVVRIDDPERGDGVLLAVTGAVARSDAELRAAAAATLRRRGVSLGEAVQLIRVETLPRTDAGKVRRRALADMHAAAGPAPGVARRGRFGLAGGVLRGFGSPKRVRELYQEMFPAQRIAPDDSFVTLGGDSLRFIEMSIALESVIGRLPEGWPEMTVAELERILPRRSAIAWVDTTIFLRCVGIIAVVALHFTPFIYFGATFMFLVVAGFNFSRFQLRPAVASGRVAPVLATMVRVAVPAILVLLTLQILQLEFHSDQLLLVSNFTGSQAHSETWYVEAYVQILLVVSLLLALPPVRGLAQRNLAAFTLGGFALAFAIAFGGAMLRDSPGAGLGATPMLSNQVPHMVAWLFMLGWLVEQATTPRARILLGFVAGFAPFLFWSLGDGQWYQRHPVFWIWAGCLLLMLAERVPVPVPLNWAVYWIGGASLFIYLTHWTVIPIWQRVAPVESVLLEVGVALVVGVAFWTGWESLSDRALRAWRGQHQYAAIASEGRS